MIVDGRTVTQGEVLRFDVCVIGAGPVGMLIARELAVNGKRVALLERGDGGSGRHRTRTTLNGGLDYDVGHSRGFGLGGTANQWDLPTPWGDRFARFREFDEDDFAPRDWIPNSGWPFDKSELRPFYDRAWSMLGLPGLSGGVDGVCAAHAKTAGPFQDRDGVIEQAPFVFASPAIFTDRLTRSLAESSYVTVLTNSSVLDFRCDGSPSHVSSVRAATIGGSRFSVEARFFILAAGGIENPRVLLASRSRHRQGLGNGHGLVGRFFMEHPHFVSGVLRPKEFSAFADPASHAYHLHDGIGVRTKYALREDLVRRQRLLRSCFMFEDMPFDARTRRLYSSAPAVRALRAEANIRQALAGRPRASNVGKEVTRAALGVHHIARFGWEVTAESVRRRLAPQHPLPRVFRIFVMAEQVPDPESRVCLIASRDEFGVPMAVLRWRLTDQDLDSYERSQAQFAEQLVASGHDQVDSLANHISNPPELSGGHHHMGTTRMSESPRSGVVDRNGLVHGVGNLYVMGTSVFPTAGYANPTLTAIALALRLADHCRSVAAS